MSPQRPGSAFQKQSLILDAQPETGLLNILPWMYTHKEAPNPSGARQLTYALAIEKASLDTCFCSAKLPFCLIPLFLFSLHLVQGWPTAVLCNHI